MVDKIIRVFDSSQVSFLINISPLILIIVYVDFVRRLLNSLKNKHAEVWEDMGQPSISPWHGGSILTVVDFVLSDRFNDRIGPEVKRIKSQLKVILIFFLLIFVLFAVRLFNV